MLRVEMRSYSKREREVLNDILAALWGYVAGTVGANDSGSTWADELNNKRPR